MPASTDFGRDSSSSAKGRKTSTSRPATRPFHRVRAPTRRFSVLRENEPPTG